MRLNKSKFSAPVAVVTAPKAESVSSDGRSYAPGSWSNDGASAPYASAVAAASTPVMMHTAPNNASPTAVVGRSWGLGSWSKDGASIKSSQSAASSVS